MKSHNKKRNVGLIYEQLIRFISRCLVENKSELAETAVTILKSHFRPGTELYKEFRLFNAMVQTTVPSEGIALRVLQEARVAAKNHDPAKLDREKSSLIRDINKRLDYPGFFDIRIPEYKKMATVQTLLNDWRKNKPDPIRVPMFESKVVSHLMEKKEMPKIERNPDVTKLSLKLMSEKLSRKYSGTLNEDQLKLINLYIRAQTKGEVRPLQMFLKESKEKALDALRGYKKSTKDKFLLEKANQAERDIVSLVTEAKSEDDLARYLTVTKLMHEIKSGDDNVG